MNYTKSMSTHTGSQICLQIFLLLLLCAVDKEPHPVRCLPVTNESGYHVENRRGDIINERKEDPNSNPSICSYATLTDKQNLRKLVHGDGGAVKSEGVVDAYVRLAALHLVRVILK
jgi:hypothetical protein